MASTAAPKRYTRRQAEALLARLVKFANSTANSVSIAEGRAALEELLDAPLGDFVVGKNARRELKTWKPDRLMLRREGLSYFLNIFQFPVFDIKVGELWVRPVRLSQHDFTFQIDGAATDLLTLQEMNLLRAAGIRQIKRCECGTVFARVGRQEFCSERCQKRVYMRAKRAAEREKKGGRHVKAPRKK